MKSRLILALVLALAVTVAGTGTASTVVAGRAFHYSFVGKGDDAAWSTCPFGPTAGAVCTDTCVSAAEQVYKEDGTKFPSTWLSFYQYSYKLDRRGNWVFISDTYGSGEATLSIDKKLTGASANASVPVTICTVDRRGNYTCEDGDRNSERLVDRPGRSGKVPRYLSQRFQGVHLQLSFQGRLAECNCHRSGERQRSRHLVLGQPLRQQVEGRLHQPRQLLVTP
jgi:hypothetical protein